MRSAVKAAFLVLCAASSHAQVVSTRSGLITGIQGSVYLDDQRLAPNVNLMARSPGSKVPEQIQIQMKNHQLLRTDAAGRANLVLTPEADLSLGSNSELRMEDTRLDSPQATLLRGSAIIIGSSIKSVRSSWPIRLRVGDAVVEIEVRQDVPQAEIDKDSMKVKVRYGRITVHANDLITVLHADRQIDLRTLAVTKYDARAELTKQMPFGASIRCVSGEVYLDNQKLTSSPGIELRYLDLPRMEQGQTLRIVKGWAELEVRYSRLRAMDDTIVRLGDQEVVLEHGTLVGGLTIPTRAPAASKIPFPPFRFGDTSIQFLGNDALFELGNPEGLLRVYRGEALVQARGTVTRIPKKSVVNLTGNPSGSLAIGKLDPKKDPPLYSFPGLAPNYFASEMQVGPQQPTQPSRCGPMN